ncbi:plasmid pRiA4b ORF-3 family protein [Methanosarcinales archaeon]|nr:MAG: plasmid pRiA4b ORF-3 family protein [Methanosarcinales archaeon]
MKKKFDQVYQFKITLAGAKPPIWRRIHVPETYTFWDLHVAIQDAMGWGDGHLHEFKMIDPSTGSEVCIGIPGEDFGEKILPEHRRKIAKYFSMENRSAGYVYDFGDNWEHEVQLEKILPREKGATYPTCIKGRRACPPEDCGGLWGYVDILEALEDPDNEETEELLDWVGEDFDPEHFDTAEVSFSDPAKRFKFVFG